MATKKFRPVTPSLRNTTVSDFAEITKKTPEKSLLTVKKEKAKLLDDSESRNLKLWEEINEKKKRK